MFNQGPFWGRDVREILVCYHRLNHCTYKSFLGLSNRLIFHRNIRRVIKLPRCVAYLFGKSHKRPWRTKGKHSDGSISNPSETIPRIMNSIYQMISSQSVIISQINGALTYEYSGLPRFLWTTTLTTSMPTALE